MFTENGDVRLGTIPRWSGLDHNEASVLGILMNTRALMELIIINVGFDLGVISQNMFTMLVIMAIASTVITTPGLRRWLPRTGFTPVRTATIPSSTAGELARDEQR